MAQSTFDLFINPTAGRGRAGRRLPSIEAMFDAAGHRLRVHRSQAVGDLENQVREFVASGGRQPLIVGGDGSVHEAVNGILRATRSAQLGVIPSGTGNDFAKACDIPTDWRLAAEQLIARLSATRPHRRIDVGVMNDRYFANGAGIGFDAKVTGIARSYRWPIGDLVYLLAIFHAMRDGIATPEFTITSGAVTRQGPVTLASVANGAWIGGLFHIAPPADNSDGVLNLVIAEPVSRRRVIALLPKLMRGVHLPEPEVSHTTVESVRIESLEPVPSHLDGEMQDLQTTFEISVVRGALEVL